jgi:Carboxypeptidase regulatory-like domain
MALLGVTMLMGQLTLAQVGAEVTTIVPQTQNAPPRDRVPPPRVGTSVLKGRVVDGVTGAPIARARVRIQGAGGSPRPSVLTDDSGRFVFERLPAGAYSLTAEKSTYMAARFPDQGRTLRSNLRPLMLDDGAVLDNVTLSMFHGASISGRVVDAHGDPFEFAFVQVLRLVPGRTPASRAGSQTNDLGEFRLPRLEAGSYVLLAAARRMGMGPEEPLVEGQATLQPLPTYYPNALSLEQAQPITVVRGESVTGVELALNEGYAATLFGTVTTSDGQPVTNAFVQARTILKGVPGGMPEGASAGLRPDGTFRMQLAPGDYTIEVRVNQSVPAGQSQQPENERFGTARVSLAPSTVENVTIVVGRGATASGRIVFGGTTPLPPIPKSPIHVPFYNQDGPGCRSGQPQIASDWTFKIEGLTGTCSGPQMTTFGRWTLKAVMHGGENLLEKQVTFEPGQVLRDVQLIFTDKQTELTFQVSDERGELTREYVALVFSTDKARWTEGQRYVRTYAAVPSDVLASRMASSATNGGSRPAAALEQMRREQIVGLPAGEYYAVAIDDIEMESSRDPRVLEQLVSSATRVTVSEDSSSTVTLRRFKLAELLPR